MKAGMPLVRYSGVLLLLSLLALALAASSCRAPDPSAGSPPAIATEIQWDRWGVPHLFAPDREALLFAFGWSQAHNHADLLLRLYGEARGRAAEYWGEPYLDSDRWVHTMGIPERAQAWYEAQRPPYGRMLDAFARGINAWAEAHRDQIADEVEVVLPVTPQDVLAHDQRVIHFSFVTSPEQVGMTGGSWSESGSNTWAIGPSRSASGHAILLANPHLPWRDMFTWHEAHWVTPEIDLYGATLLGFPYVAIAFNDHLGWSHTVNTFDGADLYELTLRGAGYLYDGEDRPFEERRVTLKVKAPDGALRDVEHTIRSSVHGPVVAEAGGRALALRVVGLDQPHVLEQYWRMGTASNLAEFEAAQAMLQMPMFTTMYADRDGHILHLFGGRTPVRPEGDWQYWAGTVPGDRSSLVWAATHDYGELPRILDPASGWLQNANDPPWTTTFPTAIAAADYPPYMAPQSMEFRPQRSARMLDEDSSMTFEEVVADKHSTRMELADRILDDLAAAVKAHGSPPAQRAMEVLEAWDRSADPESRGGVLFVRFAEGLRPEAFAVPWSAENPRGTPDGLADPEKAAAALEAAARGVEADFGALDVAWGEVSRLRQGELDLPGNGGPGDLGIFRNVAYAPEPDGKLRAIGGDSYVAVVEFSDPLRAQVLLGYGNSSQPGSKHQGDQLQLFADKALRPAWRTREEIAANLEERESLAGVLEE